MLGTERHESRRIDDQLVDAPEGRGARESLFLISMEDEIMQLFGSEKIIDAMEDYDIRKTNTCPKTLSEAFKRRILWTVKI